MTYKELEVGLTRRGFIGVEGIDSMGKCHKDKKHYVLMTDGLVIYSTIPFWTDTKYHEGSRAVEWGFSDFYGKDKLFTFEKLDKEML